MALKHTRRLCVVGLLALSLRASEYRGQVTSGGFPVPGATVTATHGKQKQQAVTDEQGFYTFADLTDGSWTVTVTMTGFVAARHEVTVAPGAAMDRWTLQLLGPAKMKALATAKPTQRTAEQEQEQDRSEQVMNGLLINGSVNNGAASRFTQSAAFGNHRRRRNALYTGGLGFILGNSALDAKPYSLTGFDTPKPSYNDVTGVLTFGGPLRIPHVLPNGPNFFVAYQWTRNRSAQTLSALVPTAAQRNGLLASGVIPKNRISPQARALLELYPLPNVSGNGGYNFQIPAVEATHQDALQSRFDKTINHKNQVNGGLAFQSTREDTPNVLGYSDGTDTFGLNARAAWEHRLRHGLFLNLGYQFSRFSTRVRPFFANRTNVSGDAGIMGNNQEPVNWGPPTLQFASGIAMLTDGVAASNHNQTSATSASLLWNHGMHSITMGGDFRREQFNYLTQQNPRGTFAFTGAATGNDFADFLLGVPDTSSIAFGNADKYLRESVYDGYVNDEWRVSSGFTLNAGIRWEYGAPITELYNRLVNLGLAGGFAEAVPVLASDPVNALTGERYPDSLLQPDRNGFEPRVGIAWLPLAASSMVVRAGYGVYDNTSVYSSIASQLAQQPPLSKTFSVQNSAVTPLTLADGFNVRPAAVANTFAIDPDFRVGYAQIWKASVQSELPGSLQMVATYVGIKGTRGLQEFLPNTYPIGAVNPCPLCTSGYVYLTSNGNSTRESAQIELRRRLHNGFTALLQYTFSKSLDDVASLGGGGAVLGSSAYAQNPTAANPASAGRTSGQGSGPGAGQMGQTGGAAAGAEAPAAIAQNWLNLRAERAPSNFDQRHLFSVQMQYTTGMGLGGGTLLSGWRGALLKEWTFATEITVGSGLPLTPVYPAAVPGTGFTGMIRPDYTGAPLYRAPAGLHLNPAAYVAPIPGEWGNAGRNSITGPGEFALDVSMGRTFRLKDRFNLDLRIDATNALNHVTFTSWNTTLNNAQFGLPVAANAMRSLRAVLRLRF